MDSFHHYVKEQIKRYIKEETKKGVPLEQIEAALFNAGHKKNIIDECFDELKKQEAGLEPDIAGDDVQQDFVKNIKSSIENFFGQIQPKQVDDVKKDLEKEPTEEIVEEAIEEYETEKETYIMEGFSFFIFLSALVVLTLYTAGSTGDEVLFVAVGFAPAFVNSFLSFALVKFADYVPLFMLFPVVVGGAFFAMGSFTDIEMFQSMEVEALAIVNTVIAMCFNLVLIVVSSIKPPPIHDIKEIEKESQEMDYYEEFRKPQKIKQEPNPKKQPKKPIEDLRNEFNIEK
ncbi:hypothetical protein GF327_03495 [Candidatus Woesearchaeota archaeon]|nr:hypothetical protein [Candidatus Woesearchaeota archaeon]